MNKHYHNYRNSKGQFATRPRSTNRAARAQQYAYKTTIVASLASRTMLWGGLLILTFVLRRQLI